MLPSICRTFERGEDLSIAKPGSGTSGTGPERRKSNYSDLLSEHYAIQAAASHDYPAFYRKEMDYRYQLHDHLSVIWQG